MLFMVSTKITRRLVDGLVFEVHWFHSMSGALARMAVPLGSTGIVYDTWPLRYGDVRESESFRGGWIPLEEGLKGLG